MSIDWEGSDWSVYDVGVWEGAAVTEVNMMTRAKDEYAREACGIAFSVGISVVGDKS